MSEVYAKDFSSKYRVDFDAVLNFARFIFVRILEIDLWLLHFGLSSIAPTFDMQDLSQCFLSEYLDTALATALFHEVRISTSAIENIAHAF